MRTKTLLLAAVLGVAGIVTSLAQNVYSVNVVGYITKTCQPGFNMICNPLVQDDTTLGALFPYPPNTLPDQTVFYILLPGGGGYSIQTYYADYGWLDPNITLDLGAGFYLLNKEATPIDVTFVGEVLQGDVGGAIPDGFSMISSRVPQMTNVTELGLVPSDQDVIYKHYNDGVSSGFDLYTFYAGYGYIPGEVEGPTLEPGQAVIFLSKTASGASWVRTFNID